MTRMEDTRHRQRERKTAVVRPFTIQKQRSFGGQPQPAPARAEEKFSSLPAVVNTATAAGDDTTQENRRRHSSARNRRVNHILRNRKAVQRSNNNEGPATGKVCAKTTARRVSDVSDNAGVDAENNCIGNT